MSRNRRSSVQKYHDRVAGRYDASYDDVYWSWHDALTWDYLKPFLPRDGNTRVVDLGCGTGKWGSKLAKSGYGVTSVDISVQMLDQAYRKLDAVAQADPGAFVQADLIDLSALPPKEYSFALALGDAIGCSRTPAKAMKEIRRVLTDRGILVATFDNKLSAIDFYLSKGSADELTRFLKDGKTHWLTKDREERFPIVTYTPEELEGLVEASGFELLEMVGKTVLPMRHHRKLLATPESRRHWARIEKTLCRRRSAIGRASHLQITCRISRI